MIPGPKRQPASLATPGPTAENPPAGGAPPDASALLHLLHPPHDPTRWDIANINADQHYPSAPAPWKTGNPALRPVLHRAGSAQHQEP